MSPRTATQAAPSGAAPRCIFCAAPVPTYRAWLTERCEGRQGQPGGHFLSLDTAQALADAAGAGR